MTFSPPSHLRRLSKPATISKDQHNELLASLQDLDKSSHEGVAEFLLKSVLKDLLKYEAFRSFRLARITNVVFADLNSVGPSNALTVGRYRQRDLIVNTIGPATATLKPEFWYAVGKITFRAFYKIWLQEEVQFSQQASYPETI